MSMFNGISWRSKENKQECELSAQLVSLSMQRDSEQDNGHSSDLDRRKSGTLLAKTVHKENGTKLLMMLEFGESIHRVFRSTNPLRSSSTTI